MRQIQNAFRTSSIDIEINLYMFGTHPSSTKCNNSVEGSQCGRPQVLAAFPECEGLSRNGNL